MPNRTARPVYNLEALDTGVTVESSIETQDFPHSPLFHYCQVDGVARRQPLMAKHDLLGTLNGRFIHREHLVDNAEQCVEGRLDRVAAVNGSVPMKDFLEDLRIGGQPLPGAGPLLYEASGPLFPFLPDLVRAALGARVAGTVYTHQLFGRYVRVFLRRGKALMAEELLDRTQVGSGVEHVGGECVSQSVRMHVESLGQADDMPVDDAGDSPCRQPAAA